MSLVRPTVITTFTLGLLLLALPWQLLRLGKTTAIPGRSLAMWGGGLLVLAGAGLAFSGASYLTRRGEGAPWSCVPPRRMVVAGPYAYVQHPIWLGLLFIAWGEALWTQSAILALYAIVLLVLANLYVTLTEEPRLMRRFGADYRAYRAAVPRWVPFRRRRTPSR
jgi:protein-S-isoprenylcysteine O-methyltransferase Ste14